MSRPTWGNTGRVEKVHGTQPTQPSTNQLDETAADTTSDANVGAIKSGPTTTGAPVTAGTGSVGQRALREQQPAGRFRGCLKRRRKPIR